jgi:hypothetical protein
MALNIAGQGGELQVRGRTLARLGGWDKAGAKLTFTTAYVNAFAAGLGPPDVVVLPLAAKVQGTYPVVSGSVEEGVVRLDLMAARLEPRGSA